MIDKMISVVQKKISTFNLYYTNSRARKKARAVRVRRMAIFKKRQFEKSTEKNPYLQSKALWNDMYGSLQIKLQNSYRVILILSFIIIFAFISLAVVAGEAKVKAIPFIIHGNEIVSSNSLMQVSNEKLKPQLSLFFAKEFMRNARTVSVDSVVNSRNKISALSFASGDALTVLKEYFEKNNANIIAKESVKNIHITSVLRQSSHTIDIRWQENWRSVRSGQLTQTKNYIAQLTYQYKTPSQNEIILKNNPFGFYISYLSWSDDKKI